MTMQARFYPPEPPRSPVPASNSRSGGLNSSSESATVIPPAEMAALRQAGQRGEFRAIATLLNQALHGHGIVVWVGEAGPGYLQITLTVKRPPQKEPLIRLVGHHLYSLQSELIVGANVTTQLAETNLILWHQLVRLPASKQSRPPSQLQGLREKIQTVLQASWQQSQTQVGLLQQVLYETWQEQWPLIQAQYQRQSEKVRSLSLFQLKSPVQSNPTPPSSPASSPVSSQVPLVNPSHPTHQAPTPVSSLDSTNGLQWPELAMLPLAWPSLPVTDPTTHSSTPTPSSSASTPQIQKVLTPLSSASPSSVSPSSESPSSWLTSLEQVHTVVMNQLRHPNYWIVGGVAIAIFGMGGGFESVNQYFSAQSRPSNRVAERDLSERNTSPKTASETETANAPTAIIPPSEIAAETEAESADIPPSDLSDPDPNVAARQSRPVQGKTVQTSVGDVEVVAIAPVTTDPATVTLTFSNDAIVPSPPLESSESPRWQWPFTQPPAPAITHPADMAIAFLNSPPQSAEAQSITASELLQQGGIDLVNLASNEIAAGATSIFADLLERLDTMAVPYIGFGTDKTTARRPQIFDVKGYRIAVLGYADTHLYAASDERAGTNALSLGRLVEDVEAIRDQVDWVIVTLHWHGNLPSTPTKHQMEVTHFAIDQGADLVVGHHPQVMQGGEVYKGRAIAYSLGPIQDDAQHSASQDANGTQTSYNTTALKAVISDRAMSVGFIPVNQDEAGASFMATAEAQDLFQSIEAVSELFTLPLSSNEMTYLPHSRGFSPASTAESESEQFAPDRSDSFIGPNTD